jgi:hypothetical protein
MIEASNEAIGSYIFKSNSLCMFSNDGQLLKVVIREGEGGQKSSSVLREDEAILSHKGLYSLHVCVWACQIRQLRLTIPLVVLFVSCASGAS